MPEVNSYPFLPTSNGAGETTAVNVTAAGGAASAAVTIRGPQVLVSVGLKAVYLRFGNAGSDAAEQANSMRMNRQTMQVLTVPEGANSLIYTNTHGSVATTISITSGNSIP